MGLYRATHATRRIACGSPQGGVSATHRWRRGLSALSCRQHIGDAAADVNWRCVRITPKPLEGQLRNKKRTFLQHPNSGISWGLDDSYPLPPRLQAVLDALPRAELAFTPVPVRARADGWTAARQRGFVDRLALCGSVATAAQAVGMTRKSAYRLCERAGAESFAAAWAAALAMGQSGQVDRAFDRGRGAALFLPRAQVRRVGALQHQPDARRPQADRAAAPGRLGAAGARSVGLLKHKGFSARDEGLLCPSSASPSRRFATFLPHGARFDVDRVRGPRAMGRPPGRGA